MVIFHDLPCHPTLEVVGLSWPKIIVTVGLYHVILFGDLDEC